MSLQEAADAPIVIGNLTFPKPTIRLTATLAAKLQSQEVARVQKFAAAESISAEAKVKLLAHTVAQDYGLGHVQDWAVTLEGSLAICIASLVQGGKTEGEAIRTVESLTPAEVKNAAMELVDHPASPRRLERLRAEAEAKDKTTNPQ